MQGDTYRDLAKAYEARGEALEKCTAEKRGIRLLFKKSF